MPFCANCGSYISEGDKFCGTCGKPAPIITPDNSDEPRHILVVSRAKQFICALSAYEVYINGELAGRIPVGGTVATRVFSDEVRVSIKCVTFMLTKYQLHMKLLLKQNPRVDFHLKYPGAIEAAVTGAEVLEETK
ncbi:MAG: zinc ribbon domain-containing protein [Synergistaceae bacterium]|nr:zinc ribbon domain-containing protein [Synergistaceae bacterium]